MFGKSLRVARKRYEIRSNLEIEVILLVNYCCYAHCKEWMKNQLSSSYRYFAEKERPLQHSKRIRCEVSRFQVFLFVIGRLVNVIMQVSMSHSNSSATTFHTSASSAREKCSMDVHNNNCKATTKVKDKRLILEHYHYN